MVNHYTVEDLLKLGWTRDLIRQHLGSPDQLLPNSRNANRPVRLYECGRVSTMSAPIQATLTAHQQAKVLRLHSSAQRILQQARMWPRKIPILTPAELRAKSLAWVSDATEGSSITLEEENIFQMEYLIDAAYPHAEYEANARNHVAEAQVNQLIRQLLIAEIHQKYPTLKASIPIYS